MGIEESVGEDVKSKLVEFLTELNSDPDDAKKIEIERVHCLGGQRTDGKSRPIISRFLRYPDVEKIKRAAYKRPRGSEGSVQEDIPKVWLEERRKLMEKFKDAKRRGLKTKWQGIILIIEGEKFFPHKEYAIDF